MINIGKILNSYSLDAPLVITCWLGLFSYWLGVSLPWWIYPWLAAWVWLAYTWDRLVDSYLHPDLINPQSQLFSLRHAQHWQHRKIILWIQVALIPLCLWVMTYLPSQFWLWIPWLAGLCLIYLTLTYLNKSHVSLRTNYTLSACKHLVAALILSAGISLIHITYKESLLFNDSFLLIIALTSYLFWLNMRCCEYWDDIKSLSPLAKNLLSIEIISIIVILQVIAFISFDDYQSIFLLRLFITILTILTIYLLLLWTPYAWVENNRLFLADIHLIICPLVINILVTAP